MSTWVYVIVIVVLVALGLFYLWYRRNSAGTPRDFTRDRETDRVSHMSEEDRQWEADSLKREGTARERDQSPPDRS